MADFCPLPGSEKFFSQNIGKLYLIGKDVSCRPKLSKELRATKQVFLSYSVLKTKSLNLKKALVFFSIFMFQAFCVDIYHTQKRIFVINDNVNF